MLVSKALSAVKTIGVGALVGDAINIGSSMAEIKEGRRNGENAAVTIAKSIGTGILFEAAGPWGIGLVAVQAAGAISSAVGQNTADKANSVYRNAGKFGSGYFDMSQPAYTMRQRSLNAIRNNGLNTQSVFGNEARTYFRGSL